MSLGLWTQATLMLFFSEFVLLKKSMLMSHQKKAYIMLEGSQSDLKGFRNLPVYI